jgi:hypothetical protein
MCPLVATRLSDPGRVIRTFGPMLNPRTSPCAWEKVEKIITTVTIERSFFIAVFLAWVWRRD